MGPGREARRAVLLGAGFGLALAGLDVVSTFGWAGGLISIAVWLIPVAVAMTLGGPLAGALAGGVAMAAIGLVDGGPAIV